MSNLRDNNCDTDLIGKAADELDHGDKAANASSRERERNYPPAFQNWLNNYRNRLAKIRQARNNESEGRIGT
jgi:hypothetical protein